LGRGKWPNVGGNRRADEMRTEDQGVCRRVRLTVRLGHELLEEAVLHLICRDRPETQL
jgi:hypothetical protein